MPLSDGIFYSYNFFSPIFVPFYRFLFIIIIIIPTFILFHYTYICAQAETSSFHPLPKENDRSEEIIRKEKKKIHPFEPYGKEIRKRKRDGVSVGTSSSRLRVLSGHGNGCQLFFSFPPLRASSNFPLSPFLPLSLSLFLDLRPGFLSTGTRGVLHFFPFVESFLERQPPLWYTRDSHSRNTE